MRPFRSISKVLTFLVSIVCVGPVLAQNNDAKPGKYVFHAYVKFSIGRDQIKDCSGKGNCPVPSEASLEECVFLSDRFPFRDEENEGRLWCDVVIGSQKSESKEFFVDLTRQSVSLSGLSLNFYTFNDWANVKDGKEPIVPHVISLGQGVQTFTQSDINNLKNIVLGHGIQNGITLNAYYTDTLIRQNMGYRRILAEHCATRSNHIKNIPVADRSTKKKIKEFTGKLDNACGVDE